MRLLISLLLSVFIWTAFCVTPVQAAERSPRIEWRLSGVGKLSSELQIGPNGLFYAPSGNKLTVFDEKGRKLWDATNSSGSGSDASAPVFDSFGSIFVPGKDMFQEVKLNGSMGWKFNVYSNKSNSQALLTAGPGQQLYLHTPTGLYAVDTAGRCKWMLYQWNMAKNTSTKTETFKVIAAAGNDRVVLSVVARDKGAAQLFAFDRDGDLKWRYSMGEVKSANLMFGPDDDVYVTVNPAKVSLVSSGAVYVFDVDGNGKPLWSYRLQSAKLSAPTPTRHNQLYFMDGDVLYALDQSTGKEIWSNNLPKTNARPAVDETSKRVYVGGDKNQLIALRSDGRVDWWLDLGGKLAMTPLLAPDGYIYVPTEKGDVYKINDRPN